MNRIFLNGEEYGGDSSSDISEKDVAFESEDEMNPDAPSDMPELKSGKLSTLFSTISTAVKNVRYLAKMLGTTDISAIGNGTLTGAISTVKGDLDGLTPEDIGALSASGGTVDGNLNVTGCITPKKGLFVVRETGKSDPNGHVIIARFVVKQAYVNNPIKLEIGVRGRTTLLNLFIRFGNSGNVDPTLGGFFKYGDASIRAFLKKTAKSTWDLVVSKGDTYGNIDICSLKSGQIALNGIDITYPNEMVSNFVESEWTEAAFDGKIKEAVTAETLSSYNQAVTHRNIFRGKNLGTSYTAAQKAAIENGSFDDLYVGDYWVINDVTWRIVDINYWLGVGYPPCTTNHLVIMPDTSLYNTQMNETNTTVGGYVGSKMYTENLENAKTLINATFGVDNILSHMEVLVNAVKNGYASDGTWYNSTVELPNEPMMYGSYIYTPAGDGTVVPYRYTIDKTQLALMQIYPRFISPSRQINWLRDVVSSERFAAMNHDGSASHGGAVNSFGVRSVFGLC